MQKETAMASLADKRPKKFDTAFIAAMTAHHKAAISMAKLAQKKSERKEVLKLAKNIITAQSKEIEQMKLWKSLWKTALLHKG